MRTKIGYQLAKNVAILLLAGISVKAEASSQTVDCQCTLPKQSVSRELKKIKLASNEIAKTALESSGLRCESIIKKQKNFKTWNAILTSETAKPHLSFIRTGSADLKNLCPNFDHMPLKEKNNVWISILNAMATLESTCNPSAEAEGPNGRLHGILQLHTGQEKRYSGGCQTGDAHSIDRSLKCGLSMLNDQLARGEPLFSRKSYWDVLRPQAKGKKYLHVKKALANHPGCKLPPVVISKVLPVPIVLKPAPPLTYVARFQDWWQKKYFNVQESVSSFKLKRVSRTNLKNFQD